MPDLSTLRRFPAVEIVSAILVVAILVTWLAAPVKTASAGSGQPGAPTFLQVGRCYRFTFAVAGTPNWKVLEVLEGDWVRAEADAGPASAQRESAWINTSQIVTARAARCSA